ncbi:MAG: Ribonuclease P protein component [uncultured bacterium]|nr:MAG: Ribonuclease P protein component [uncultured bacterium]
MQKAENALVYRFLSKHPIRHAAEFDVVFKLGKRFSSACFVLIGLRTDRGYPRLGMVINKKNCALSVDRNRIKRVIREKFRLSQHLLLSVDVIVQLRSSSEKISDQEQNECLEKLFSQLIAHCDGSSSN